MRRLPLLVVMCTGALAGCPARSGFDDPPTGGELTDDATRDGDPDGDPGAGGDPGGDGQSSSDGAPSDQETFVPARFLMQYDRSWVILALDRQMVPMVPEASLPAQYEISPALPRGVTLDATTGTISGQPLDVITPFTTYDITATTNGGSPTARTSLRLAVVPYLEVDTIQDLAPGGTLGDGVCGQPGTCSIRAALAEANALAGVQGVVVPAGNYGIATPLVLNGDALLGERGSAVTSILATGGAVTVIRVDQSELAYLADLDVTSTTASVDDGGCLNLAGTVSLTHLTIHDCRAAHGGGIDVSGDGRLEIERSTMNDNAAAQFGGAIAVQQTARATVATSIFRDNLADSGAAIAFGGGSSTIMACYLANNEAQNGGGAVRVLSGAVVSVSSTTFESNTSGNTPGALLSEGTLDVAYSTFSGNLASGPGAVISVQAGSASLRGVLMLGQGNPCDDDDLGFASSGYNVFDGPLTVCPDLDATTDITSASLGNFNGSAVANGGPTPSIAIDPNGAAHDVGDLECPLFDQRGEPRPDTTVPGATCDAGAYELGVQTL